MAIDPNIGITSLEILNNRMKGNKYGKLAILATFLIVGFLIVGQIPIHNTSILHTDDMGDVSDQNIDIVEIRSYLDGSYVVLEMVVSGEIQTSTNYTYRLTITARGIVNSDVHIYSCTYENGTLTSYAFNTAFNNNTLRVYFPLSAFASDSYMIGLEGNAHSSGEEDNTGEDRESDVSRLLFRLW
jgi:hypothetical protein